MLYYILTYIYNLFDNFLVKNIIYNELTSGLFSETQCTIGYYSMRGFEE